MTALAGHFVYAALHLYIFVVQVSLNSLPTVVVVLNATFKVASLNNFVILRM
jgi:hypothetical protein